MKKLSYQEVILSRIQERNYNQADPLSIILEDSGDSISVDGVYSYVWERTLDECLATQIETIYSMFYGASDLMIRCMTQVLERSKNKAS